MPVTSETTRDSRSPGPSPGNGEGADSGTSTPLPTVTILDVPVYAGSLAAVTQALRESLLDPATPRTSRIVTATSAHGIVLSRDAPELREVLRTAYLNLPDGRPLVWVGALKGATMEQCMGPVFFEQMMRTTAGSPIRHYFAGGRAGVADRLRQVVLDRLDNGNVVGTYCPPFRAMTPGEWEALSADIARTRPDVVWVGLSTPKQELFARELARHVQVHMIATIGAAFDFHTGSIRRAPGWMSRSGLEWSYRLAQEPRRLYRRYLEVVPKFIVYNTASLLTRRRR